MNQILVQALSLSAPTRMPISVISRTKRNRDNYMDVWPLLHHFHAQRCSAVEMNIALRKRDFASGERETAKRKAGPASPVGL